MFHLWIVGNLPFSLHDDRHKPAVLRGETKP
jgi:hypothetical protein